MRVVIGLGLLLLACGGKSASEGDARGGASGVAGSAGSFASDAGHAGSAGAIDESDPAGVLVVDHEVEWLIGDADRLYWLDQKVGFEGCRKDDCANSLVSYPSTTYPSITTSDSEVIWQDDTGIQSCPKAGCDGPARRLVEGSDIYLGGADGEYVYWTQGLALMRCNVAACSANERQVIATLSVGFYPQFSFHGSELFWSDGAAIWRTPKDSVNEPRLVAHVSSESRDHLAIAGERVVWLDGDAGGAQRVLSCPLAGCGDAAPTVVVSGARKKTRLKADETNVYWLDESGLQYCPSTGCDEPMSLTADGIYGMYTLDARYVYWAPVGGQSIRRRLKPGL